jgi:hypothetical protein
MNGEISMKKSFINPLLLTIIINILLFNSAFAQPGQKGPYAAVDLQVSSVNQGLGLIIGLSGGYQTKEGIIIGGEIYDLLNNTPFPNQDKNSAIERKSKMHFGGIVLGYEFGSSPETRFRVSTLIGAGDISAFGSVKNESEDASIYFVAQPKISVCFFRTNNLHLVLNTGYRFHYGVDTPGTSNSLLNGVFLGITGEYGWQKSN